MPQANTYAIEQLAHHIQIAIEDNYDVEKAMVATDVFATQSLSGNIYSGDDTEVQFDGGTGFDIPVFKTNAYNGFDFNFLGGASGTAGTPDISSKIFRMCGANETVVANTSVSYVTGDVNSLDSATAKMFEKVSNTKYLQYLTTGARAQLGFSFENSKKAEYSVKNMLGSYHQPSVINTAVAADFGTQKSNLPLDVNFDNTHEFTWNGHQLCVQSMSIDNVFGLEFERIDAPGCKSTRPKKVMPIISVTARVPDFDNAFNPYVEQETGSGIKRRPFVFTLGVPGTHDGKILTIRGAGANELQMTNVQKTTIGNDKFLSFDLRCFTGLELLRT